MVTVFFKSPLFLHKNKIFTLFCIFIRLVLHYFVDLSYITIVKYIKMKTLAKIHKDQITKMINENERVSTFKAYCKGAGFDTTKYSSPIHISEEGKLTMRYRTINTYHYIRL